MFVKHYLHLLSIYLILFQLDVNSVTPHLTMLDTCIVDMTYYSLPALIVVVAVVPVAVVLVDSSSSFAVVA